METQGFWLSPLQEHVWSLDPGTHGALYRVQALVLLEGVLECDKLQNAPEQVVARHDILRTIFVRQIGMKVPFQVISDNMALDWKTTDLSGLSEHEQRSQISEIFDRAKQAPFALESGPQLRTQLLKLAANRNALILSLPALCSDAWTLKRLVAEVSERYSQEGPASDELIQYVQFAQWHKDLLDTEDEQSSLAKEYWRKQDLSSLVPPTLPLELRSSAPLAPAVAAIALSSNILQQLDKLGNQLQTLYSTVLLAAWHALLWRVSPQERIAIDTLFSGREYEEFKPVFGLFSHHLPISSRFDGSFRFEELVAQLTRIVRDASEHQEHLSPDALGGREQAIGFEFIDLGEPVEAGELGMKVVQLYSCTERYKIKLVAVRRAEELGLEFHYDANRYSREAVARLAAQFRVLLADAMSRPEKPINELRILSGEERQRLLVEWNGTARAYPAGETIASLFEAQAAKTPERVAVVAAGQGLRYGELNRRANQLAHALRRHGVGADRLVGLCLDRSVDLMVGLLGILKAGGAYVPLNPDNPKSRLEQQLSGVQVLVTQSSWREKFPEFAGTVVCLDGDSVVGTGEAPTEVSTQPDTNPAPLARPENLVYVIYTSGSTGVPKGVQIEHRNLVNYTRFMGERLALENYGEGLQFATVSTLSADLGNTCIYPALLSGGTVHLVSYEEATDVAGLGRYVEHHAIDVLKIVPSHLAALLSSAEGGKVLPRKYLITGGEALSQRLLDRIAELQACCEVINHYGPTETTVGSLTLRLQEHPGRKWEAPAIAIGRPIANTRVYILDPKLQPVPVGVVGELYLGGAGVGRGYRNQPQMTAERFLKDPFVHDPNARLYRTGDLARYLEDGNVEFLGRADDQVKVRGFRIELGEIESALASHPGVKHAVVLAREDLDTGEKRLVGYVVLHRKAPTTAEDLRQHLGEQLPDYMVPSALVTLDKLPLNANGKVDRQALPSPEEAGQAQPRTYLAPRTPVEEVVANIWAEVLRLSQVGADDNFFALGGHSLLATQVVSRLRRVLGVELPLRMMFEAPTVEKLAEKIEVTRRSEEGLQAPPITPVSRDGDLPLSFAQQRLWFLDQLQPDNPVYNIPRALRIRGRLSVQALEQSLNEIVRRHESQRTVFKSVRGQPVQVVLPAFPIPLPVVDLGSVPDSERASEAKRLAVAEAQRPFDLAKGPLLRTTLLRLSDEDHVLLLNTHHIVSDAWSAAVMIEEIGALYEAFAAHRPSPLPEPAIQYADFAAWQRQWLQGEVLQKQLAYWRTALEGAPAVLELATDRPRPAVRTFLGDYELVPIPRDLIEQLSVFSRKEDTTLFMTLMTAFQALLSRYSGQEQIIVGTDLASRTSVDTERLIGFFISVLPIHGDVSGDPRFREFLKKMRDVALGAYAHQDLPLDKIVEELQPERSMSHNPLVQVLFVMQNTPRVEKKFADLTFHAFEVGVAHSKFDLAVFVVEQHDGILGSWLYSTDLFDAATIRRMAGHYENLLRSILAQPDTRISALEFMSETERLQRAQEAEARKKSQFKKILSVQPKAVTLANKE